MQKNQRFILYILILIAGASWIALNTDKTGASTAGRIPAPQAGFSAPDFTLMTPDGESYTLSELRGQAVLVNLWATWCPPCVEELPLLDRFYRENSGKGFQVVGIAIDQAAAVRAFLARMPLGFPVALAGADGLEMVKSLGNLAGGLPYSVVLGSDGDLLHRKMGKVSASDLAQWALLK